VLPDGDIKTCEDFRRLDVVYCETCHHFYPHYEMSVIDLPLGGKAWVSELELSKSISPIAISCSTAPKENKSLRESNGFARTCSGDM
jgi:hypothetical protein